MNSIISRGEWIQQKKKKKKQHTIEIQSFTAARERDTFAHWRESLINMKICKQLNVVCSGRVYCVHIS